MYNNIPTAKELFEKNFTNKNVTAETLVNDILGKITQRYRNNQYNTFFYDNLGFGREILSKAHLEAIKILKEKGYKIVLAPEGLEIDYSSAGIDDENYFTRSSVYSKIRD